MKFYALNLRAATRSDVIRAKASVKTVVIQVDAWGISTAAGSEITTMQTALNGRSAGQVINARVLADMEIPIVSPVVGVRSAVLEASCVFN